MSSTLSPLDIVHVSRNVAQYAAKALSWVKTSPPNRDQSALPCHIASINALLQDLRDFELLLPPITFAKLHIHLTHVQDMLSDVQRSADNLLGGLERPDRRQRTWERGGKGRWRLWCNERLLRELHGLGMRDKKLMKHLKCSKMTLMRWKKKLGLSKRDYGPETLDELQAHVSRIWKEGSGLEGWRYVWGRLKAKNIRVKRSLVRDAIRSLDTPEAQRRFARTAVRRVYQVPFANSLWHIDGHHKLIDVKIVIHGGIDGKSRKIVFLKASPNNRAATVFESFEDAVRRFGLPSRVRGDYGKENLDVKRYMEHARGNDHHAFIQGPSTRNQRIERLWVEVQWLCTWSFRCLFDSFIEDGILNVENPLDLWCLHLCYLPMLNDALQAAVNAHDSHGMDDLEGESPQIMWWDSVLDARARGIDILADPAAILDEELHHGLEDSLHRPLAFAEYGLDDYGRRAEGQLSDDDPLVDVQPVLGHVHPALADTMESQVFQTRVLGLIGPWSLGMQDQGRARYIQCREVLDEFIRSQFPQVVGQY